MPSSWTENRGIGSRFENITACICRRVISAFSFSGST